MKKETHVEQIKRLEQQKQLKQRVENGENLCRRKIVSPYCSYWVYCPNPGPLCEEHKNDG